MFCRKCGKDIADGSTFCRFCGTEVLGNSKETSIEREYRQNNELYNKAQNLMSNNGFDEARQILLGLSGFRNADELAEKCLTGVVEYRRKTTYDHAIAILNNDQSTNPELIQAAEDLEALGDYQNSETLAIQCRTKVQEIIESKYRNACKMLDKNQSVEEMTAACETLEKLDSYKDSAKLAHNGRTQLEKLKKYLSAISHLNNDKSTNHELLQAAVELEALGDYKDSEKLAIQCRTKAQEVIESKYSNACKMLDINRSVDEMTSACEALESLGSYKDSVELARNGRKQLEKLKKYISAIKLLNCAKSVSQYMEVIETFDSLGDFLDSKKLYNHACKKVYEEADEAVARYSTDKLAYAASTFEAIKFYEDAGQRAQECRERQLALIAQNEEQKRRDTEEADELELQHCLKILNNPKAQEEEIGKVLDRLILIKNHEGAEEAIQKCHKRLKRPQKMSKRNLIIAAVIIVAVIAFFVCPYLFE